MSSGTLFTMTNYVIDLRSDTVSLPTAEMRQAMFDAKLGDDVYGEDPTVNELEAYSANLFQKDAALFVPSGTMGNLIAMMVHCHRRGTATIVGDLSHTFLYEQGGASHIGGIMLTTIKNKPDGTFCLNELRSKISSHDFHEAITALVVVENTQNICGGRVVPLDWLDQLAASLKEGQVAGRHGHIKLHMDGARVFNAATALQVPVSRLARDCDSLTFCLSKGLSAPVGSVLVGSKTFINEARRLRKALGGGMRQSGVLAAAGLVALKTVVPRLVDDHRRTKRIAQALHTLKSSIVQVDPDATQTNILLLHCKQNNFLSADFGKRLEQVTQQELNEGLVHPITKQGIKLRVSARDWEFIRLVLYQQITDDDTALVIKKLEFVVRECEQRLNTVAES